MRKKLHLLHILFCFVLVFAGPVSFSQVTISSSDALSCVVPCTTLTAHLVGIHLLMRALPQMIFILPRMQ